MDSTTTGALRVVLNVTEVSAVAEMERMRAHTERIMKAYHFQQTMRAYGRAVLTKVNALWDATVTPMTRDEYELIMDMGEGEYDGPQYRVNILVFPDDDDDDNDVMAFVEPTLDPQSSYLIATGPKYEKNRCVDIPLADLETLANFLGDHPHVYDAFMGQMTAYKELDLDDMDFNTPSNAIVVA